GRRRTGVASVWVGSEIVPVIGDRCDVVVRVGVEMLARLALVPTALNHVIKMRDHAGGDEHLAAGIEVDSPRVAGAVCEDLEFVPYGMVPPDASVDRYAIGSSRSRLPHTRVR